MVNKNKIFSVLVLCGACCGTGLYGADTTINASETTTQGWAASGVDENNPTKVIFQGDGAINASPAANITKEGESSDPRFLTIDFQNEPTMQPTNKDGSNISERAHIFAKAIHSGNSDPVYATALNLAEGNTLKILSSNGMNPVLAAYSYKGDTGGWSGSPCAISTIISFSGKGDHEIILPESVKLFSFSSSLEDSIVSVVLGIGDAMDVNIGSKDKYLIGNHNCLLSSSYINEKSSFRCTSIALVVGAASCYRDLSMGGSNVCEIGFGNMLTAVSGGYGATISAVVGGACGSRYSYSGVVSGENTFNIGNENVLISSSSSSGDFSGSIVIGAISTMSSIAVTGENMLNIGNKNVLSSLSSSLSSASASVIGAIKNGKDSISTARGMSINLSGSQTISALAYAGNAANTKVSVFGADDTDKSINKTFTWDDIKLCIETGRFDGFTAWDESTTLEELQNRIVLTDEAENFLEEENIEPTDPITKIFDSLRSYQYSDVAGTGVVTEKYGWRVGIYNEEGTPAVVNILGAKLAEQVVFAEKDGATAKDAGTATVVLSADQGSSYQDYARAFALGKDFQIYIGGKSKIKTDPETKEVYVPGEGESQFEVAGSGTGNVVNIFGAIAPAQYAANTIFMDAEGTKTNQLAIIDNTKLVVDNNWIANVYGPIEGLEKFTIKHGAVVNAFDRIQRIGSLRLKGGTLNLKIGGRECLEAALMSMTDGQGAPQLTLTHKIENGDESNKSGNCAVESITLADDYESNENRFAKGGKLTLGEGEVLRFYIDTSSVTEDGLGGVGGMIKVDSGLEDALDFQPGSRIEIVDDRGEPLPDDPAKIETIPAKFVLLQADGMGVEEFLGQDDFANLEEKTAETWALKSSAVNAALAGLDSEDSEETGEAAQSRGLLKGFVRALYANAGDEPMLLAEGDEPVSLEFDQDGGNARMYLNGTVRRALQSEPSLPGIGSSSAQINTAVVSVLRNAINPRLAGISSRGDGAFIYGIGGHVHQSSIAGIGYGGDLYGVAAGADKLLNYKDGCVRLGAMIGYIYGDVDFHGSAIDKKQKSKQDNYLCALYCAYGSINEKNLKTDLNLSCGFGYTKHRLSRVDQKDLGYNAKMKSNNFFLSAEFIKNLYAVQGVQFGLWLRADYNHIHQKAYSENGGAGAQSISKAKFDFLDTTIGINIEKEIQNSSNSDRSLRLYMKAGWNCQPMRSHSTIVAGVNGKDSVVSPHFGSHNSAVFTAGLRQKLNARWDLIGEWNGSFNKKHSNNLVTLGAGYTF